MGVGFHCGWPLPVVTRGPCEELQDAGARDLCATLLSAKPYGAATTVNHWWPPRSHAPSEGWGGLAGVGFLVELAISWYKKKKKKNGGSVGEKSEHGLRNTLCWMAADIEIVCVI